ncbi:hypothetical protein AX17_002260 [Amanita inopinata Kibby_2008]|nr:hypothetical protein AX17_002260 [Amanita inopinata Kibby_2008]
MVQCTYKGCTYKNLQRSNVATHERRHSGEKNIACPTEGCDFRTGDPGTMTRHRKRIHSYRPIHRDDEGNTDTEEAPGPSWNSDPQPSVLSQPVRVKLEPDDALLDSLHQKAGQMTACQLEGTNERAKGKERANSSFGSPQVTVSHLEPADQLVHFRGGMFYPDATYGRERQDMVNGHSQHDKVWDRRLPPIQHTSPMGKGTTIQLPSIKQLQLPSIPCSCGPLASMASMTHHSGNAHDALSGFRQPFAVPPTPDRRTNAFDNLYFPAGTAARWDPAPERIAREGSLMSISTITSAAPMSISREPSLMSISTVLPAASLMSISREPSVMSTSTVMRAASVMSLSPAPSAMSTSTVMAASVRSLSPAPSVMSTSTVMAASVRSLSPASSVMSTSTVGPATPMLLSREPSIMSIASDFSRDGSVFSDDSFISEVTADSADSYMDVAPYY